MLNLNFLVYLFWGFSDLILPNLSVASWTHGVVLSVNILCVFLQWDLLFHKRKMGNIIFILWFLICLIESQKYFSFVHWLPKPSIPFLFFWKFHIWVLYLHKSSVPSTLSGSMLDIRFFFSLKFMAYIF